MVSYVDRQKKKEEMYLLIISDILKMEFPNGLHIKTFVSISSALGVEPIYIILRTKCILSYVEIFVQYF